MILNFKTKFSDGKPTNFPAKINNREKIHTIREDKHNRWKTGYWIDFSIGARTKHFCKFNSAVCSGVQSIEISHDTRSSEFILVKIDGRQLDFQEICLLAKNDGFDSVEDFFKWFSEDFNGKIIHWTNLRY